MRHVLFDDIRAPDAMLISAATVLQDVIIRGGKKAAALWCKPPSQGDVSDDLLEWSRTEMASVDLAIDFSGLSARDSEVVGIPLSKLKWNPEIHIPVSLYPCIPVLEGICSLGRVAIVSAELLEG